MGVRVPAVMIALAAFAVAAVSCARPDSTEQYIMGSAGPYNYTVDMSDTLANYDFTFYSRIDVNNLKMSEARDFPLTVTWTSPSGRRYRETVYFGIFDEDSGSNFYSKQFRKPYRTGVVPVEAGIWDISVEVDFGNEVPGLRGLGLICKKNL